MLIQMEGSDETALIILPMWTRVAIIGTGFEGSFKIPGGWVGTTVLVPEKHPLVSDVTNFLLSWFVNYPNSEVHMAIYDDMNDKVIMGSTLSDQKLSMINHPTLNLDFIEKYNFTPEDYVGYIGVLMAREH